MNIDFQTTAVKSLRGTDPKLTLAFQKDAYAAGWPKEIVSKLSIAIQDLKIVVKCPEKFAAEIEDLEYGSLTSPPKPVIRLFMQKHSNEITTKLSDWSVDTLISEGLIP